MALGGLALKLFEGMWALYDKKYGKYGEARVKQLQLDIVDLMNDLSKTTVAKEAAERALAGARAEISVLTEALENEKKKTALLQFLRVQTITTPDNPF